MFELLFRYPVSSFAKGQIVLLSGWPVWLLAVAIAAAAGALGWFWWQRQADTLESIRGWRSGVLWGLQAATVAVLLLLLWQPALTLSTLKPQQNIVAVVVDDSKSMAAVEDGKSRIEVAKKALDSGTLAALKAKFQTRVYRMSETLDRVPDLTGFHAAGKVTRLGDTLQQLARENTGLPLGAVILVTDGADNSGGLDADTLRDLRSRRVPIHTVGIGRERPEKDVEVVDVVTPARALADTRVAAQVSLSGYGYAGTKVKVTVRDGSKVLAAKEVTLAEDGKVVSESVLFNAGTAGAHSFHVSVEPLPGETNSLNNGVLRLINVTAEKPRILYIEGEPRWEFKFIRRAVEDDRAIQLVTMLRTTQNKIYRQGIAEPKELEQGFPASVDELFGYQAVVIGSVEFNYFTTAQQELLKQFVDRRGGGLVLLGGRSALSDGGWARSSLAELLPVNLPERKDTFHRDMVGVELTAAGRESLIARLEEDPEKNAARWKKLPALAAYQEIGTPKPGATVLADVAIGQRKSPFLVTQNYGRGRVVIVAGDTWRWQMQQPVEDSTHETFWRQVFRYAVSDTPGRVLATTPRQVLADENRLKLNVDVRDRTYLPAADAKVEVRVLGPGASGGMVELQPDAVTPGQYTGEWSVNQPGQFVAEALAKRGDEEVGRDVFTFQRQDGVAENFHTQQNRELLEKLANQTGGRYWKPEDISRLPEEVSLSEAGITVRETRDLWNLPAVFLLLLLLKGAEWLLRRKWGVV